MFLQLLSLLVIIAIAILLYPHQRTIMHMITGNVYVHTDCGPLIPPKLNLKVVRECKDVPDLSKEPCVIRNAVSEEALQNFLHENGDQAFNVRNNSLEGNALGNPLSVKGSFVHSTDRTTCTINDLLNHEKRCIGLYTGFKSLNFSNYLSLNSSLMRIEDFVRTDIFMGYTTTDRVTASFHSNNFEKSSTLQILGEKVWLMMKPSDYYGTFKAYALGAYNAAFNVCSQDLSKVEMQTIHTFPGDVLVFPKAWAHHIYSRAGPNFMVNFRNTELHLWKIRDFLSLSAQVVAAVRMRFAGMKVVSEDSCDPATKSPTSFGQEHPNPSLFHKPFYKFDMRCGNQVNHFISVYIKLVADQHIHSNEIDHDIYRQIFSFLGEPEPVFSEQ